MGGAFRRSRFGRVVAIPDFRLYWIGAFLTFTGFWVQTVARGYYVFQLTGDEGKLAAVVFAGSLPVALFGLFLGGFSDVLDKRRTLIVCQILLGLIAIGLAYATWREIASYELLLVASVLNGLVSCFENTTRQSVVSRVVPRNLLAAAVPVSAMTFNLARIVGPALGGIVLAQFGVPVCFLVNGISFLALIWAVVAIRADLSSDVVERPSMRSLFLDGMAYVAGHARLRLLLLMETITACFGVFYVSLIPSYVERTLGQSGEAAKTANGHAYSAIGVGALLGLALATTLTDDRVRIRLVQGAMFVLGVVLFGLAAVRSELASWPLLAVAGACAVIQFNTTNGLFQTLAPDEMRGRVLSLHIWALNGLSPFGVLALGYMASLHAKDVGGGVPVAMRIGGGIVFLVAAIGVALGLGREEGPGAREPTEP